MPLSDETAAALAREAMEKAGGQRPRPVVANANNQVDRLKLAATILSTAIDAHQKAGASLRAATDLFIAEYAASVGANVDVPSSLTGAQAASRAFEQIQQASRPKTFNAPPP